MPHRTLLHAIHFSAQKHRHQRRKDRESSPYINHPLEVAYMLQEVAGVDDLVLLMAAVLHDTIEDTETSVEELTEHFGQEVCDLVLEVTDDKSLPKEVRKQLQIDKAHKKSERAALLKMADKICNVVDLMRSPPFSWTLERRVAYLDWAERVISGLTERNEALLALFERSISEARQALEAEANTV